jgi:PAS domain S-box-containing protein
MTSVYSHFPVRVANLNYQFRVAIFVCLVGALAYLAAVVGVILSQPGSLSPLWPGCAFLLAVLLCAPRKIWPALIAAAFAGVFLYNLQLGLSMRAIGLLFVADNVEILVAALGISYTMGGFPRLNSIKHLALYSLFAVILAPALGAFVGAAALGANYWAMWRISFFSEALALLTVTPAILGYVSMVLAPVRKPARYYYEAVVMIAGVVVLGYFIFVVSGSQSRPALLYSLVPFLLWSALRFGTVGISTSMLVVAFFSIWGTVHARGLFIGSTSPSNVLSLQLFLLVATIPFTTLAALVEERKEAEQAWRDSETRERAKAKELETVLDAVPVAVLIAGDPECKRIRSNRAGCELLRLRPGANASKSAPSNEQPEFRIFSGGVEVPAEQLSIQRAAATAQQIFDVSESLVFPDGGERSLISNAAPLIGEDGKPYGAVAALLDVTERDRAVKALRESEEWLRLAIQAGKMYAYEWNVTTGVLVRSPEYVNVLGDAEPRTLTFEQVIEKIHPDDRSKLAAAVGRHSPKNPRVDVTYRVVLPGKAAIWVKSSGRGLFDEEGKLLRVVGIVADITDQKLTEEALRDSEERLRLAQKVARVGTFERNIRTGVNTWTAEMESMYGLPPGGFGQTRAAFENLVHPDDREKVTRLVDDAIKTGQPTSAEWRVIWPDGSVHWIAGRWQVLMDESGEPSRVVGVDMDITERKLAEEALSNMTRNLVEAQEQERARIARELHDDVNQRLALLTIELEQLRDDPSRVRRRLQELKERITNISTDIHAVAHDLHSSKLEYLGVAAGMKSWCREFAERRKLEVDCRHGVRSDLPTEIGLCLFRVLQQALDNAAKHSGVKRIEVQLNEESGEVHLIVSDSGRGFDVEAVKHGKGLGLTSMRERVRLVNGTIAIASRPMGGTTIHVRVPIDSSCRAQQAAV